MTRNRILIAMAVVLAAVGVNAYAFHSGGVAECGGCHSMHTPASTSFLLVGSDASSACLSCHDDHGNDTAPSSYHVSTGGVTASPDPKLPVQATPGGDFAWLKRDYDFTADGTIDEKGGHRGHSVIAADYGYQADDRGLPAPGGSFPSTNLGCQSCHDPHGEARRLSDGTYSNTGAPIIGSGSYNTTVEPVAGEAVGIYRLLFAGASERKPANYTTVPVAIAPSTYNRYEGTTQTRVAYAHDGANTWGAWCGTCHGGFNTPMKTTKHPIELAMGGNGGNDVIYNTYKKTGDMTGTIDTAFTSLVPLSESFVSWAGLKAHAKTDNSYLWGANSTDNVTCMSCHRAHATGFEYALRWDMGYEFITKAGNYVGSDNPAVTGNRAPQQHRGRKIADWKRAYYERDATQFATYQRVLCNKCHAQD